MNFPAAAFILGLGLFVAGCASGGRMTIKDPVTAKLGTFEGMSLEVSSKTEGSGDVEGWMELDILRTVRERSLFDTTPTYSSYSIDGETLKVAVTITKIKRGTGIPRDRGLIGALAPRAKVTADVVLSDTKSGAKLGSATIHGKSSWGSVLEVATLEAAEEAAKQVVEFLAWIFHGPRPDLPSEAGFALFFDILSYEKMPKPVRCAA